MGSTADRLPAGPLTYEDYLATPNDGNRYEILDGELSVSPSPSSRHQQVLLNLASVLLSQHVREHRLGTVFCPPMDVVLSRTTVVQPDILFVAAARRSIIAERAIEGPPDLVVEIVSTSSARQDRTSKAALYARFGIIHYWIVDPGERTFEMYELEVGAYRLTSRESGEATVRPSLFPGLEIQLSEIWA